MTSSVSLVSSSNSLKPIFHCDAKYLASGVGVGQCPRRQNFALEIPTCWYILALPNAKICVFPDANPQRQSVEYRCRWAFWHWGWRWACTFHIFCVDFICVWWSTQTQYPVEYGLNPSKEIKIIGMKLQTYLGHLHSHLEQKIMS